MAHRRWWFGGGVLLVILICGTLWAKQGIIHLKDGTQVSGDITDDPNNSTSVSVVIGGVQTSVPRDNIDSIEYTASLDDQFNDRLSKLDPKDVDGRIKLAQWAYDNNRNDLARRAATAALELDPQNPQALQLLKSISSQTGLNQTPGVPPTPPRPHAPGPNPNTGGQGTPTDKNYLTADDINEIRQLEMKPTDTALRVTFANDVKKRYLAQMGEDPRQFNAQTLLDQAREILNRGDPSMANDIRIVNDPSALAEFHQRILPVVMNGCAASGCHDMSTAAGGFGLFTKDTSAAAWYTNFYILQNFSKRGAAGGTDTGTEDRLMIDRTYPDKSLIIQYGLPARVAETPHPLVPNFHQIFTGASDVRYRAFVSWMSDSLKPNGGDYPGIHYNMNANLPATQPALPGSQPK